MPQTIPVVQYPMPLGDIDGATNFATKEFVVANTVTINYGDFVYLLNGTVTNASVNGARLIGMALGQGNQQNPPPTGPITGNATGTNTVLVVIDPHARYLLKSTTALPITNNTNVDIGQYFDITGSTGAQTVSLTSTTLGAFLLVDVPGTATFPNTGISLPAGVTVGVFVLINSALAPYVAS
jgi:hypothetical protein